MAINGRKVRIKLGGGSPVTYTAVAGARSDSISLNNGEIDITDKDDLTWRTLLDGGIQSVSCSVEGVLTDDALIDEGLAQTISLYEIDVDGIGTFAGSFQIRTFELTGAHEDAATFSATFESSGEITYLAD